jgi:hypothetical protein
MARVELGAGRVTTREVTRAFLVSSEFGPAIPVGSRILE